MQTGIIYFIKSPAMNAVKIGLTTGESANDRMISMQTGCPDQLEMIHVIKVIGVSVRTVEADFHKIFSAYRIRGEWFQIEGLLKHFIEKSIQSGEYDYVHENRSRWAFSDNDHTAHGNSVGLKSGNCPFGAALYEFNQTKNPLASDNAALRMLVTELSNQISELSSLAVIGKRFAECYENAYRDMKIKLSPSEQSRDAINGNEYHSLCMSNAIYHLSDARAAEEADPYV